jgi:hypothetical protein
VKAKAQVKRVTEKFSKARLHHYNRPMRVSRNIFRMALALLPALCIPNVCAQGASPIQSGAPLPAIARRPPAAGSAALPHRFWDRTNVLLFSGVAAARTLDYFSTKNMLRRGREEILIPDDVVYSSAGFPSLEAAAAATSVGLSYVLHRTGHHTLERWLSIGHIGVADFGAARNYSLKSRHQ